MPRVVPPVRARAARRSGALAVLVLLSAVLGAVPAAAHNTLRSTDPGDGATVATAPAQVTLTFDQAAVDIGTQVVVTGPDGVVVSEGPAQLVDVSVVQPLAATLPAGAYTVDWRITSADGHPLSGTFAFTAAEGTAAAPTDVPSDPPTADATSDAPVEETPAASAADDTADDTTVDDVTAVPTDGDLAGQGPPAWLWIALGLGALGAVGVGTAAMVAAQRRAAAADAAGAAGDRDPREGPPTGP